ncbi:MAG: DUF3090 family protein [Chloroflexi bacterium]|jgi:uncharacterized repeat protein (TIGR03847 family)|nr:MAG: hypothetical protein UZ13_00120 [Chloroflexi bacterium OLB13]MBV6437060.1 hypothetical protein [Anaerolineae bacterium]MCC6567594.1 DUF3090 family protein [Chloroflexota bacterium]MDL1917520.1 DUF3090 family protein [Anaerolineae bacterium CFX4]MBW7880837.1 DUF3090 family protein [Anaerolineae bacterium]
MPNVEIDLNPVDFITIGTIGPKGQRVFYLQAGRESQLASMIVEKEQSWALSEALRELIDDVDERRSSETKVDMSVMDMDLREPIEPLFRVSRMGLGFDEDSDRIVLIMQELIVGEENSEINIDTDDDDTADDDLVDDAYEPIEEDDDAERPSVVRLWCSREQMRALSIHAANIVKAGRADPRLNGRLVYYWT